MGLFAEPKFDRKAEADQAFLRISRRAGGHNLTAFSYVVPLGLALFAVLFAAYALTRPSVAEKLQHQTPAVPTTLEVDLE